MATAINSTGRVLPDLSTASREQLLDLIANMRKASTSKLTLKVSEKGALSVYGMGRWPITLYRAQWERLLDNADVIKSFISANGDRLAVKPD